MTHERDTRERHGSHLPTEFREVDERYHSEETAERLEVSRNSPAPIAIPFSWSGVKELGYVVGAVLTLAGGYYGITGEIRDGEHNLEALTARVLIIERGRAENLPRLEEQVRNNAIQDTRIQNLTDSLGRVVATVGEVARIVSAQGDLIHETHEREAVLEERLGHVGPHDR